MRVLLVIFSCLLLVSCSGLTDKSYSVRSEFQTLFKNVNVVEVKESEIPNVYEIYYVGENTGMLYFYPEKKILIFGELWDINGTSITGEKLLKFFEKQAGTNKKAGGK